MKEIVKNFYYVASGITGAKLTSYYIAILIVSILSLVSLSGLALLLQEITPTKFILIAFKFPFYIATEAVLFFILYKAYPSNRIAYRNPNKTTNYLLVVLSVGISLALYAYSVFAKLPDAVLYK